MIDPFLLGCAAALFGIAALESEPRWGRFVPGHFGLAIVACVAVGFGAPWWGFPIAAWAGAFASDAVLFGLYALKLRRGRRWWEAGLDADDLSESVHEAPWRTVFLSKWSTKQRARLPYAAGKSHVAPVTFLSASLVSTGIWASLWVAVGGGIGWAARYLSPAWGVSIVVVALVALLALVNRPFAGASTP